ncbi:MAG: phosphoadenosine phosphosulfate reductase family protein, partial [Microthrixaceae bacterium]|nr:phosphoadenosine phosphosulfate reductase family protein [Microthrixaceae bacterium]
MTSATASTEVSPSLLADAVTTLDRRGTVESSALRDRSAEPRTGIRRLDHLRTLESESIHIIREVVAEFERPVLLFSGGKDSVVMLHLAIKDFLPARLPFAVMHIDTGHNFDEVIEFRDQVVDAHNLRLVVASVQEDIDAGRVTEQTGPR